MKYSINFSELVRQCVDRLNESGVDALGALFDLTSQRLVRLALAITRNQHDAEDAVQTALARIASRPLLLKPSLSPWAYLLQIVRNEALLIARHKRRCVSSENLNDLLVKCPVDELDREETYRAIWSALRTLPPEQAEVVTLKIWEDMTFVQIGEILELSPNTAASRYQYGMNKLSKALAKERQETRR